MKKKIVIIVKYLILFLPFLTSLWVVTSSLNWGIPDPEIRNIVLPDNDEARKKTVEKIINLSQKNIQKRESFVIEGQEEDNSIRNLRIARRYLLYSENPDEMMALAGFSGINPKNLNFKLKCFQYGGGYLYPMGAMVALERLVNGKNLKVSMKGMISDNITIGQMYIWARAFNIIILVIGFAGLFLLFYSQGITKINAVFFSSILITSPVLINWATVIKPHLMGAVFLVLSAGVALYGRKRKCLKKYYFISMFLAGIACAAQYLMIGAGIIPTLLTIQDKKLSKAEKIKTILIGIAISAIAFFVLNPYHPFNIDAVVKDLQRAGSFYHPEFFNPKIPLFDLWIWAIGIGFVAIPLLAGILHKWNILSFCKKNIAVIITILFYGYYGGATCISGGFQGVATRLFIPMILLISILLVLVIDKINNKLYKKTVFILLYFASLLNLFTMNDVLKQGADEKRSFIEASKYLQKNYHKYDNVYFMDDTPAPYKNPAANINANIKTYQGQLKKNELLVTQSKMPNMKLIKSFEAEKRYFKISFAEKDFFFYEK